ncbi:MAG TPA: hypothetical protein VMW54_01260 [Terriglobia bacterium]|nr:hypothetical protein [Terriglobia bacterium]
MAKATPITEQYQHFVRDLKESFRGDLCGKTRQAWERFWEEESRRARDRYLVTESYERVKADVQAIYRAEGRKVALAASGSFAPTGEQLILPWSSAWSETCPTCSRSSASRGRLSPGLLHAA